MRWPIVVLAALAAFPTVAGAEVWREQSRQDADARGLSTIEIHNARGRIDVTPSSDGRIHLTAIKIVHLDGAGRARDLADQITVDTDRRGDHYVVEVHYPQRASFHIDFFGALRGFDREFEVRIAAEVPPALGVEARSASGVVTSEGVGGAQLLRTASGDIEVRSAGRRVEVSSSSGAIEASDLGASARIHSVSGDLTLHHVRGALDASTSSGAIRITGA
ncbi:MAG: DUF4097 family beta strand repeat protein [Candidatus Eisenbacteria bacterium]|nr:DUF4097 family beta strand repeat protein [Candidatus Eisenbacteria bacterium]